LRFSTSLTPSSGRASTVSSYTTKAVIGSIDAHRGWAPASANTNSTPRPKMLAFLASSASTLSAAQRL